MSTPVVITDNRQWAGQFDCTGPCRRKRLVGAEFSKTALERYRKNSGGPLKCKQCVAAVEAQERMAAKERAEAKAAAADGIGGGSCKKEDEGDPVTCAVCRQSLPTTSFNRNQLNKAPGKARCRTCVEAAVEKEASVSKEAKQSRIEEARKEVKDAERRGDMQAKVAAESVLSALEAEVVTGLKPVALGKGRSRGGRWSSGRGQSGGRGGRGGRGGKKR